MLQGALAFAIVLSVPDFSTALSFGLFPALIGEAIGVFLDNRPTAVFVTLAYIVLATLSLFVASSWSFSPAALFGFIPVTFFVVIYTALLAKQIDGRVQAEIMLTELENANRKLAAYAERIKELTVANERQHMARELHDTLAQDLSGLVLQLEAAESFLENARMERTREIVHQAMDSACSALAESRDVIRNLRGVFRLRRFSP